MYLQSQTKIKMLLSRTSSTLGPILYTRNIFNHKLIKCSISYGSKFVQHIKVKDRMLLNNQNSSLEKLKKLNIVLFNIPNNSQEDLNIINVRLYPEGDNRIVDLLHDCESVQQVLDVIDGLEKDLNVYEASQAIMTLSYLHKSSIFFEYKYLPIDLNLFRYPPALLEDSRFLKVINCISKGYHLLPANPMALMLLHLSRIGIHDSLFSKNEILELVLSKRNKLDLKGLHSLILYLNNQSTTSYYPYSLLMQPTIQKLHEVKDANDLYDCAECFIHNERLVTLDQLILFRDKINNFIEDDHIKGQNNIIINTLKMFNKFRFTYPQHLFNKTCSELMLQLNFDTLNYDSLCFLRVFSIINMEPREAINKINERTNQFLATLDNEAAELNLKISLSSGFPNLDIEEYKRHIKTCIRSKDISFNVAYHALRNLKLSNHSLCNEFWDNYLHHIKMIHELDEYSVGGKETYLSYFSFQYMNFNNNLSYSYRNYNVEFKLIDIIKNELINADVLIPSKFCSLVPFIIAYCDRTETYLETINIKLKKMLSQINISHVLSISRGISISLKLNKLSHRWYSQQMHQLCTTMDQTTAKLLKTDLNLEDLIFLFDRYLDRSRVIKTGLSLVDDIVESILVRKNQLTSKGIKSLSLILHRNKYYSQPLMDMIGDYVTKNSLYVTIQVLQQILKVNLYNNLLPHHKQKYLDVCIKTVQSDGFKLTPHNLLEYCFSLATHLKLNSIIIRSIFRISFLNSIEDYIVRNSFHERFPNKLRFLLMELNRAVCIDYPEENVPWFHEKYCESLSSVEPIYQDRILHEDVEDVLSRLLNGKEEMKILSKTPYHYELDFELMLDENNIPIPILRWPSVLHESNAYTKIAVILRRENEYCSNVRQLGGRYIMQRRHLEIMGYKVVEIPHFVWYSMALADVQEKKNYLKSIIFDKGD